MAAPSPRTLPFPRRLLFFASVPAALIAAGTVGYRLTERWPWFDAFYVAVITLTSIGYGDKHALSIPGRVLTLALALGGISTVALAATELLGTILTGELRDYMGKRRMARRIGGLEGHVIVCGYGHVGQHVCLDLVGRGVPVVAIDRQAAVVSAAAGAGAHTVLGDATGEAILRQAGLERARALVTVVGTDADNVLITMTAHLLRPDMPIVSRAEAEETAPKLLRAGATRTACPDAIAGGRMAEAVLAPAVLDADLQMKEQLIRPGSALDGSTVAASGLRRRHGLILVAIRHPDGRMAFNPADDDRVAAGDTLITLGTRGQADGGDALALSP